MARTPTLQYRTARTADTIPKRTETPKLKERCLSIMATRGAKPAEEGAKRPRGRVYLVKKRTVVGLVEEVLARDGVEEEVRRAEPIGQSEFRSH